MSKISAVTFDVQPEDLKEKVVAQAAELVSDWIREEAHSYASSEVQKAMKKTIDEQIKKVMDDEVTPIVKGHLDAIVMKETNTWGEQKGYVLTFKEYLVKKAEEFLREKVDYEGKGKEDSRYSSFSPTQTRITHMVHQHLHYSIESAMKEALKLANSNIVKGIEDAVKIKLSEVQALLKVGVTTK